ncbi:MAG: hypothetical protein AAGD32_01335 [Planctomycetota bacterium]
MGIRETLNQNEKIVTIATIVIIGIALLFVAGQLMCSGRPDLSGGSLEFYYTTDGQTFFADEASKIYPFDKDGAKAFRAFVYECPDGERYIGYIEGYTPQAQETLRAARAPDASPELAMGTMELEITGKMIALPENIADMEEWAPATSRQAQAIMSQAATKCEGARPVRP